MTIPHCPDFVEIDFTLRDEVARHSLECEIHSDFNFSSLWAWGAGGGISTFNGNLCVRFRNQVTGQEFFGFHGRSDPVDTARGILNLARDRGCRPEIRLVSEGNASKLADEGMSIELSRDDCDYVFSTAALAHMSGPDWTGPRQIASRFVRRNKFNVRQLNLADETIHARVRALRARWDARHESRPRIASQLWSDSAAADWPAFERLLLAVPHLNLDAIGIEMEGDLAAILVGEVIDDGMALGHFMKSDYRRYPGITEVLLQAVGRFYNDRGCGAINGGSDDGIPHLRDTKRRLRPLRFLNKYTVRP